MGIVYKAHDTKLDRTVALKFLPQHLSANEAEESRFLQEARAASALNHPNVCVIHAIGEHAGQSFIDMEYVDGVTLRRRLATGPLPLATAVSYAIQIGDALQEAHAKNIVHRDIKCENIMINSKNMVKVMDFGLAKLKGSLKLTRTSSTVGTLAYMSPEQIQGGEVDARADIFSFGVVLFEMLTGHLPFRGDHEAAMMYSILNEEPESALKFLPEAPAELLHVFGRALEKNPEERYQSVHDMVIDIRRLHKETTRISRSSLPAMEEVSRATDTPRPAAKQRRFLIPSVTALVVAVLGITAYFILSPDRGSEAASRMPIAVADFVNQTGEKELDGLSGMLITAMEQSRRLSVLTRSRMFDILNSMGKNDVDKIDEALGKAICNRADVGALVTASIRKFGKLYTIDLKVLDTRRNEYIFTAKEDGEGQENIPSMLDKLSEKTRIGLREQAQEVKAANVASVTTSNLEAYQHFFQGEQYIDQLKFPEAEIELQAAVGLDSTFGLAWYRLAYTLNWNTPTNYRAKQPLAKALSLVRGFRKRTIPATALDAEQSGSFSEGIKILKDMEKIFPDDKEMMYNIGDWSYHANDLEAASHYLEKVLLVVPAFERALQHLSWTYRDMGRYQQMIEIAKRYVSASGSTEAYSPQ
jgi:serine/threonine protein kinase